MTTPDPLATYLITGGLPRVCEELARLMQACHHAGCDGYQLPRLPDRGKCPSCLELEADGETDLECSCVPPLDRGAAIGELVEPAPTSSPGEDKPTNVDLEQQGIRFAKEIRERAKGMRVGHGIDDDDPNHPTYRNERDAAREELERVMAKNARLQQELDNAVTQEFHQRAIKHTTSQFNKLRRVRREVRRLNAAARLNNLVMRQQAESHAAHTRLAESTRQSLIAGAKESERLVSELRAELAEKDAFTQREFAQRETAHLDDVMRLNAELAKRNAVVEAARLALACLTEFSPSEHSAAMVLRSRVAPALSALEQHRAEPGREIVAGSTCQWHEEHEADDGTITTGPDCGAPAAYRSCVPHVNTPTCARHKCRCAKPIVSDPPVSEGEGS